MNRVTVKLRSKKGLHARPATEFLKEALNFKSEIKLIHEDGRSVNGKSITSILSLGLAYNSEFHIEADGTDADEALFTLKDFCENRIGD